MIGTGYQYNMQCTQLFCVPLNGGLCYYDQTSGNRVHNLLTYLDQISVRRVEFHFKTQPGSVRVYWTYVTRNLQGVEACNFHMFAFDNAREYSSCKGHICNEKKK